MVIFGEDVEKHLVSTCMIYFIRKDILYIKGRAFPLPVIIVGLSIATQCKLNVSYTSYFINCRKSCYFGSLYSSISTFITTPKFSYG